MTKDLDLSIREIDDLLQHLYLKLRGKKEGLSLAEPAVILLAQLKTANPAFYAPQLARFTPIIMDILISGASVSFGFEGLKSLVAVAGDIELATGDYIPAGVEEGLSDIRKEMESISAVLEGKTPGSGPIPDSNGKSETGTGGFFRENAWGMVGLPLISTYNTGKTPFSTGRVVKARIEIRITGEWSVRKKHNPAITFDHISAEPNSIFEQQIRTAVGVAENYATTAMGMKGILRVPREYRISLPEIATFPSSAIQRLSGGSAGLAITALLISVLSSLDLYKQRLKFDTGTTFTGKVEKDGRIKAVEDSHIAEKVRAVFFSRFSKLILPAGNYETANNELAVLSREYPSRRLDLVPAPDITGICRDSRVTEWSPTPTGKPLLQRLFYWRKHLAASLVPLLLAVLVLFILPPYLDRNVDLVEVRGGLLIMNNIYGRQVAAYEAEFYFTKAQQLTRTYHHDLDGKPGEEILVIASESRQVKHKKTDFDRLHFLVFSSKGQLLHDHAYSQEDIMGKEMNPWAYEKVMTLLVSDVVFLDELGKGIVAVGTNYGTYTPAAIIKADVIKGEFDVFFHKGYFPEMTARDFDGDGIRELLIAGFNTSLDASFAAVIDPVHMTGSSPSGHGYDVPNMNADIAKYYIKFPEFRNSIRLTGPMHPFGVSILNSADTLQLVVKGRGEDVAYFFTGDMNLIDVEVLMSHTRKRGRVPDSTSSIQYPRKRQDEHELQGGVRYWDGENWTPDHTINRSYLEHSGIAIDSIITQVSHDKRRLLMKNSRGTVITRHEVDFDIPNSSAFIHVAFGDFLEAEGVEIVVALCTSYRSNSQDPHRNKIFILVFDQKGSLLREHVYHEEQILGAEMERAARRISLQMTRSTSTFSDKLEPGWIFICTHHRSEPPASLVRISLEDGSYETFFHKGVMSEMTVKDIDGDGKMDLLLTGYNALLDTAVIIILDPDCIAGSSPRGACYEVAGENIDIAKYYIKLPPYHRFVRYTFRAWSLHTEILNDDEGFRILVKSRTEDVLFTIGSRMTFTGAEIVEEIMSSRGKTDSLATMDFPEKEAEEEELLKGVRFWNGESWVSEPAVNKSYLKHVAGRVR